MTKHGSTKLITTHLGTIMIAPSGNVCAGYGNLSRAQKLLIGNNMIEEKRELHINKVINDSRHHFGLGDEPAVKNEQPTTND